MKKLLLCACLAAATSTFAAVKEVDALLDAPSPPARTFTAPGARVASQEPRLGVPTFVWLDRQADAPDLRAAGVTPEEAARRALATHAALYGITAPSLAEAKLTHLLDTGRGAIVASFERRVDGRAVFHERLRVVLSRRLEPIALSGFIAPAQPVSRRWRLSADTALGVAADTRTAFTPAGFDTAGAHRFTAPGVSLARAQATYFTSARGLVPAWYVELDAAPSESTSAELVGTVVSALDGEVLWRKSLTQRDAYSYRVWADPTTGLPFDGPYGRDTTPHPTGAPDGTTLPFVSPSLLTLEHGGISTGDVWLPTAATTLTGNNVDAYADLVAPDGFNSGDFRASPSAPGAFDYTYDLIAAHDSTAQRSAGLTQLFFTINWLHDWFYDHGFDEAAGNAQEDNYGRGGVDGDSIKAEGQDVGGLNNANMSTPSDGAQPRMQMYLWQPSGTSTLTATPGGVLNHWTASFGPGDFNLTADAVVAVPRDGCAPLTNNVVGRVVLMVRTQGQCGFEAKVLAAQQAGAVGAIILNTTATGLTMGDTTGVSGVTIPSMLVSQTDGAALEAGLLSGPVTLTLTRDTPVLRDGSLDNSVVAHEWGHYLSNRLVPGLSTQQARGMGEGWGDFLGLLLTVEASDAQRGGNAQFQGVYAMAVYDTESPVTRTDALYYGLRRVPYSTDFAKNALSFRHIADGEALPTSHPLQAGGDNAEVHNTGEVWATMLWEIYAAFINAQPRLTFTDAQDRMVSYLVAGLAATPSQPTFTEARDAMLAAAAANDLEDYRLMLQAFARRGLGTRAVSPPRNGTTNSPLVEDFNSAGDVQLVSLTVTDDDVYCDRDGVLDVGERGVLRVTARNFGADPLSTITAVVTSDLPGLTLAPLAFPALAPLGTATAETPIELPASVTAPTAITFTVTFSAASLPTPATATASLGVHYDDVAASSASDDAEAANVAWTFAAAPSPATTFAWRREAVSPLAHHFFGPNPSGPADISLVSPPLTVGTSGFSFSFSHRYDFEFTTASSTAWDGAVLELSTDDGATWADIGASASPGYNVTLSNQVDDVNPLRGRAAFGRQSVGYPAFHTTTVTLGNTYDGQTVRVRLRIGADANTAATGWEVDDLVFTGLTNTPFPTRVTDRALCVNRPPVANAGADLTVDERAVVTLDASASTDADGDTLTATWTQVAGPTVVLTGNTFTAPEVTANQTLRFALRVNDGTVDSDNTDEVEVTVRNVNRAPVVTVGADFTVDERAAFTLMASTADVDGDAVTVRWRQVSGPAALLGDVTQPQLSGAAPEVTTDTPIVFEATASDGTAMTSARVTLTVRHVNRAPSVSVLAPTPVDADVSVVVEAIASDPDGDAVTVTWLQVSGPDTSWSVLTPTSVEFRSPAPGSSVVFEATVSDGALSTTGRVTVVVRGVASAGPRAVVSADVTVESGGRASLSATGSSGAGTLEYQWEQIGLGGRLQFDSTSSEVVTVTAPEVKTRERLTVQLRVRDSSGQVAGAVTHVIVEPKQASGCGCASVSGFEPLLGMVLLALLRRRRA